MKYKKILAVFLMILTVLTVFSFSAYALNWDGSSAGGSTNAVNGSSKGYVIRSTNDSNCVVGYRFSVVNESGGMKVNKVIDVFRNTANVNEAYNNSAKFTAKYNKKQLIANKNAKLTTSQNTTNCYKESAMGFVSSLPNPAGVETWQAYESNINKVLTKIGVGTVSNMVYGDKVIIEPLFDVCLAGEYQALTVSEIAYCGRSVKGGGSDGGTSNGTSSTWGFIANYTNRIWPNKLYTPNGQGLWDGVSAIGSSTKATFNTILTKGYGAGIAYNETTRQILTVCYDCYGSNVTIDTSKGYKLGAYNRICSTTERNKTVSGTANVYYQSFAYNNAIGGSGLHNFSTFGLSAPKGYSFAGWKGGNTIFNETTTTYKPTDFTDDIKNGDAQVWLSAQFKPITYTVKYNANGGTGTTASSTHTYDVSKALTANGFTRTGYIFNGWSTKTSGSGTNYTNKQSVKNLTATNGATVNLYAKWTPNKYTVTYNANGGSGAPGNQTKIYGVDLTLSSVKPTRSGYTFNGWNTNSGGTGTNYASGGKYTGNANLTLYAKWTPTPVYTIAYNANGGTGTMSSHTTTSSATIKANAFTRTGYTFDGWIVKRSDNKYYHSGGTGWTIATTGTRKYNSGESYNFSSSSWRYASGTSGTLLTGNRTFTFIAQWKPVTYTVSYNANGGTGAPGRQTKTHGVDLTLSSVKPTRTGYTFNGWNTNSSGTGTNYASGGNYTANSSVNLYAKWTPITYTIKFDGNGSTGGSTASMTMTYDVAKALTANGFKRTGYTFTSWSRDKNGQGACYADKQTVKNMTTVNGAVITLYAQWQPERTLSLEAITPNAAYREGTDVITSFNIINKGNSDCVPDDNVSVVFKVYKDNTVIKTVTKTKVVVPCNEKNPLYFKWTVPENLGGSTIYISGEIVENGSSYSLVKKSYSTCKYAVYTTPDTHYEANAPENFVKPTVPTESKLEMKWSVWEYTDTGFVKKSYGLAFSMSTPVITPAANSNSKRENGFWIMKSGYSFDMSFHNGVRAVTGYAIPTADAFTWPQYTVAKFPEFSYLGTNGNCKTLEISGSDWVFRENADYGRVHFTPLWYPDGEYVVTIHQSDMWTPAGMITQKINTNQIKIKDSAYDDWFVG